MINKELIKFIFINYYKKMINITFNDYDYCNARTNYDINIYKKYFF